MTHSASLTRHGTLEQVHTRRIASFILGAWVAGSLFMIFISIQNGRSANALLLSPLPEAAKIMDDAGKDRAALLLRHAAAEETRSASFSWEKVQISLAIALGGFLFLGTQKRLFPLVLCGAMFVLVLFQHFGISTELAYLGRETDFPPGDTLIGPQKRMIALEEVYYAAEAIKLVAAGILASFLFVFRPRRGRKEVPALDPADSRAVNG
jgi:hypothetical protein